MVDFRAVPQSLRTAATEVGQVATAWQQAASTIRAATLTDRDYGYLGGELVAAYRKTVELFASELDKGYAVINDAAVDLDRAATGFERLDASYYRKFGYSAQ